MTDNLKLIIFDVASLAFLITIIIILLILKHKENKKNMNEESKTNIGQIEPSGNDLINKELAPLKALEILKKRQWVDIEHYTALCEFIETALKDYEKKTKLAKEYADVNNVAKRLKAFEIIKEKPQTLHLVKTCENYDSYFELALLITFVEDIYSQEEYELLKGVLL